MKKSFDLSINKLIADEMDKKGLTVKSLAQKADLNFNTVRGYIHSGANIPLESLQKIAKVLDVSIAYLLGEKNIISIKEMQKIIDEFKNVEDIFKKIIESH